MSETEPQRITAPPGVGSPRTRIMLTEWSERNQRKHDRVVRIVWSQGDYHNLGSICLGEKKASNRCSCIHLDLACGEITPYLIGIIAAAGGDFRGDPAAVGDGACLIGSGPKSRQPRLWPAHGHKALPRNPGGDEGESACWAGSIYESWRAYEKPEHAVAYLKRYFDVIADGFNQTYTQEWIDDECITPTAQQLEELQSTQGKPSRKPQATRGVKGKNREMSSKQVRVLSNGEGTTPPEPPPEVGPFPGGAGWSGILREVVRWIHADPFQRRRRYAGIIEPVAGAPIVTGWDNRVTQYAYARQNGPHFGQVYRDTSPFIAGLHALTHGLNWAPNMQQPPQAIRDSIAAVARDICIWGGVQQRNYNDAWRVVRDALLAQDNGSPMNSGWTKVASFATDRVAGNEQTIWDSRVATSLIWRIDQLLWAWVTAGALTETQAQAQATQFGLGTIASMSVGTRPRFLRYSWQNGYGRWQFHLRGSEVVREIVKILNDPANGYPPMPVPEFDAAGGLAGNPTGEWTVFGVGLVLFMDGW